MHLLLLPSAESEPGSESAIVPVPVPSLQNEARQSATVPQTKAELCPAFEAVGQQAKAQSEQKKQKEQKE